MPGGAWRGGLAAALAGVTLLGAGAAGAVTYDFSGPCVTGCTPGTTISGSVVVDDAGYTPNGPVFGNQVTSVEFAISGQPQLIVNHVSVGGSWSDTPNRIGQLLINAGEAALPAYGNGIELTANAVPSLGMALDAQILWLTEAGCGPQNCEALAAGPASQTFGFGASAAPEDAGETPAPVPLPPGLALALAGAGALGALRLRRRRG